MKNINNKGQLLLPIFEVDKVVPNNNKPLEPKVMDSIMDYTLKKLFNKPYKRDGRKGITKRD